MKKKSSKKKQIPSIKEMEHKIKKFEKSSKKPKKVVGIIVFLIIIAALLFLFSKGYFGKIFPVECSTAEEFIEKANNCQTAAYTTKIGTSTIKMQIISDCKLKKTILELDETEPEEIRNFFAGKEMICNYDKGMFDQDFVYQISGPLEECKGSLVDAINAII